MTDISSAAPVVVDLMEKGIPGEAYNVCSGVAYKIGDLLNIMLNRTIYKGQILLELDGNRSRPFDEKVLLGDNMKLINLTGWKPSHNMTNTIGFVLNYWREEVYSRYDKE